MAEDTKGLGQKGVKGATKDCFIFGSWLYSNNLGEATMDVGADMIGMFKTNTKKYSRRPLRI